MPADPGYKNLKATDVDDLRNLLYKYAMNGESLIDTVKRMAKNTEYVDMMVRNATRARKDGLS